MVSYHKINTFLGEALEITNGTVTLAVTLDVGPRIISLSAGGGNIMFNDLKDEISKDVSGAYEKGDYWHIYGGHRMWLSPEEEITYYPDNNKVNFRETENGAVFEPPLLKDGVRRKMTVEFTGRNSIKVSMSVKGTGKYAVWGLTVLKPGGVMTAKLNTENTGYLPNRNLVFWSYSDLKDERFILENDCITVKSNVSDTKAFKLGAYIKDLEINYLIDGTLFKKIADAPQAEYPDFGCNFETYTNNLIHEIETLSPLAELSSDEWFTHTEYWEIYGKERL